MCLGAMSVTCDKAFFFFFFPGMRERWRTSKRDKSLRKKKEREEHQIAGKEQRSDDVTKTKLMKLLNWVGWSERKWKMPTCLKISGWCKLVLRFKWCLCSVDSIQILLKLAWVLIGHFRVPKTLTLNEAKCKTFQFMWNWVSFACE